jgi:hypothetical protein
MLGDGLVGHGDLVAGEHHREAAVVADQPALGQVHRRRPDEGGDEQVDRGVEQSLGRVRLLQLPILEHRHPVAEGHRLDLIMGHIE